jgi:hypothetical protein
MDEAAVAAVAATFIYPALPVDADAIRILTLEPGDFLDPLIATLQPATFRTKPRYVALSYTWNNP